MIQINDDYYEDLTPETTKQLLAALKEAGAGAATTGPSAAAANAKKVPTPGPLSGRQTCENSAGQTNLHDEPWGVEKTRADL